MTTSVFVRPDIFLVNNIDFYGSKPTLALMKIDVVVYSTI